MSVINSYFFESEDGAMIKSKSSEVEQQLREEVSFWRHYVNQNGNKKHGAVKSRMYFALKLAENKLAIYQIKAQHKRKLN